MNKSTKIKARCILVACCNFYLDFSPDWSTRFIPKSFEDVSERKLRDKMSEYLTEYPRYPRLNYFSIGGFSHQFSLGTCVIFISLLVHAALREACARQNGWIYGKKSKRPRKKFLRSFGLFWKFIHSWPSLGMVI